MDADFIVPISELLNTSCEFILTGTEPNKGSDNSNSQAVAIADELDTELLDIFHGLTEAGKQRLIGRAQEMLYTHGAYKEINQAK